MHAGVSKNNEGSGCSNRRGLSTFLEISITLDCSGSTSRYFSVYKLFIRDRKMYVYEGKLFLRHIIERGAA